MADVNLGTNSSNYINEINDMIAANDRLIKSLKDLGKVQNQVNSLTNRMNSGSGRANQIGRSVYSNVRNGIQNRNGRVLPTARNASFLDKLKGLSSQVNSMVRGAIATVSNSSVSSRGGARSIGSGIGSIISNTGNKAKQIMGSLFGGATVKNIGKVATGIGLVTAAIEAMYKAGQSGYSQNIKLKNSLTQLGEGAEYAYKYANKLNDELGTPLNTSIGNISSLAAQLKGTGGWSTGAAGVATRAYDLSTKVGLFYQNDPQQVFEAMQRAILTGENTLLNYNIQVSDEVLAGWLAATKGINMYSVELSEGAKQAYRWMMIQEQLTDVAQYSGDLTNSTFAKQLQMMNKLEEMGIKLKALFMPLFSWLVEQANTFVDTLLNAVNSIRTALGMEKISWQNDNIAERSADIVSNIDKQNAAYRKQGELLKKNANQKLPFDEWISLDAMQQMNQSLEDLASGEFEGFGTFDGKSSLNIPDSDTKNLSKNITKDMLKDMSVKEIEALIKTTDRDGLFDLWDNFNLIQKGMYGTDIAVELFQKGEIGKGLEALLYGAVGSFTGIEAIKELASGDYVGAIASGAETALFWFGGWKGKLAAATGELVQVGLKTVGVSEDMSNLSSIISMIGIMIGGWKGALVAALAVAVPLAAKLGEVAGQMVNMKLNETFGTSGTWGKIQSWDSRTAANITYGKGTPEAEAEYYRLMTEKFGSGADIPKYASGGIALTPHLAEIGHGREAVIPLDSPEGLQFANDLASMITSDRNNRSPVNDSTRDSTQLIVPVQYFIGDTAAYNTFVRRIRNSLLDIERSEGGAFSGSNQ